MATASRSGRSARWSGCAPGIAETDDAATTRRKLSASVAEFVSDHDERRWIEPRLAHLLGLEAPPPGDREELFAAWRAFFERIAERRAPTVMVFEDLQWADPGLLDFIESMLEWSKSYPILIVTLARPELADRRANWGSGQRSFTAMHLEPLPDPVIAELVEGFVRGMPSENVERIVARAEGMPLYAVETVRMLVDRGALEARDDAYVLVGEVGDARVPETLHALIAARFDALPPEDRALVQDASVVGMSFTVEGLAAVAGRERAGRSHGFASWSARSSWARGRQALPRARPVLVPPGADQGGRLLDALEARPADPSPRGRAPSRVARRRGARRRRRHPLRRSVRRLAGGPGGRCAGRPRPRLAVAGGATGAVARLAGAGDRLRGLALDVTPKGPSGPPSSPPPEAAAMAAHGSTEPRRCTRRRSRSTRSWAIVRPPAGRTAGLYEVLGPLDRRAEAAERMERALEALGEADEGRRGAAVCEDRPGALARPGARGRVGLAERALTIAERLHLNEVMLEGLDAKHQALFNIGRHREARILGRRRARALRRGREHPPPAWTLISIGVYSNEDDPAGALGAMLECADVARRAGDRPTEMVALPNAAEAATELGRWAEADDVLARLEGVELTPMTHAALALCEVILEAHRGDPVRGRATRGERARHGRGRDRPIRTWFRRVRSLVSLLSGDPEEAFEDAMGAVDLDPAGMNTPLAVREAARAGVWSRDPVKLRRVLDAMAAISGGWIDAVRRTAEAGLAALEGRREDAVAGYERALEDWRALECRLDLASCAVDMAHVLAGRGDHARGGDGGASHPHRDRRSRAPRAAGRSDEGVGAGGGPAFLIRPPFGVAPGRRLRSARRDFVDQRSCRRRPRLVSLALVRRQRATGGLRRLLGQAGRACDLRQRHQRVPVEPGALRPGVHVDGLSGEPARLLVLASCRPDQRLGGAGARLRGQVVVGADRARDRRQLLRLVEPTQTAERDGEVRRGGRPVSLVADALMDLVLLAERSLRRLRVARHHLDLAAELVARR